LHREVTGVAQGSASNAPDQHVLELDIPVRDTVGVAVTLCGRELSERVRWGQSDRTERRGQPESCAFVTAAAAASAAAAAAAAAAAVAAAAATATAVVVVVSSHKQEKRQVVIRARSATTTTKPTM
jgi:predicted Fe-S protein YdhL (DUF1289 family)